MEKHFLVYFFIVLINIYSVVASQKQVCGWPDSTGVCVEAKNCPKKYELNTNFLPKNNPNLTKPPIRCEKIFHVCCKSDTLYCKINEVDGKCVEAKICKTVLQYSNSIPNYGIGNIEERRILNQPCKNNLVCCAEEIIPCEIGGKPGHCNENCELKSGANYGIDILEPRRGSVCKAPTVCCSNDDSSFNQANVCYGTCAKTCINLQNLDYGEGSIEFRRNGKQCDSDEMCCDHQEVYNLDTCGRFNAPLSDRIVGGIGTEFAEHPWLVQITRQTIIHNQRAIVYICAGALIHPKIVVTGAHCVAEQNVDTLFVRAGVYDVHETNEEMPHQNRKVKHKIVHENFYSEVHLNNIALLILEDEFKLDKHIGTICLARSNQEHDFKQKCVLSGWGKTGLDIASNYSEIPKKINLNIIPSDECQTKLRRTKLGGQFTLHSGFICAFGRSGEDACKGDGGAPLVCTIPGNPMRLYQAGIVSWGIGCGENPGVYVNIAKYRDWIDAQLNEIDEIDTNTYSF